MLVKIELLIVFAEAGVGTAYFFDRENKIVLPHTYTLDDTHKSADKVAGLIQSLGAKPLLAELDPRADSVVLNIITSDQRIIKMGVTGQIGIYLAQTSGIPLFIDQEILAEEGILITQKFIEEMLQR